MNEEQSARYLGEERVSTLVWRFSVPCVLSMLLSYLYSVVDQIFVGNSELSTLGNAAVGVVFPLFVIAQAVAWCFGDGCAAYLNICQGQGRGKDATRAIGSGILATVLAGLLLVAVGFPLRDWLLSTFGASDNTMEYARAYFNIVVAFFPVYMLFNMLNGVIRADGSPNWSMASVVAGAAVNLILDPIFIFGMHWGMQGAAWATVIGQTVSLCISLYYFVITRPKTFRLDRSSFRLSPRHLGHAVRLGLPSFVIQMTIVVVSLSSNMMLARYGALSRYGADIPVAIFGIQNKVYSLVVNLPIGIALGCQPIVSYNIGARKIKRVKQTYKLVLLSTLVIGAAFTLLFQLAPELVIGLFGEPSNIPNPEDYWEFGVKTFRIFLAFILLSGYVRMTAIFLQSAGAPVRSMVATTVRDIFCFIPLVILLPRAFGVEGILYAGPIADLVAAAAAALMTILLMRRLNRLVPEAPSAAPERN